MRMKFLLFLISITMISAQSGDESNPKFGSRSGCFVADNLNPQSVPLPPLINGAVFKSLLDQVLERIPEICVTLNFNFCSNSPSIHLNLTSDGVTVVDQDFSEETEICEDKDISDGGCKSCLGIKEGELIIKPNYGQICPHYFMKCVVMGIEIPLDAADAVEIPCEPWGHDCSAGSIDACLETEGCGWCDGGGRGIEFDDDTESPSGKGCTAKIPAGENENNEPVYRPFCANCDPDKFLWQAPPGASAMEFVENNPGQVAGITIGVAVFVLLLVGCFVHFLNKKRKKDTSFAKINEGPINTELEEH